MGPGLQAREHNSRRRQERAEELFSQQTQQQQTQQQTQQQPGAWPGRAGGLPPPAAPPGPASLDRIEALLCSVLQDVGDGTHPICRPLGAPGSPTPSTFFSVAVAASTCTGGGGPQRAGAPSLLFSGAAPCEHFDRICV